MINKFYGLMASAAVMLSANSALAEVCYDGEGKPTLCPEDVPEISAMEGTAALVALAAIVLLTWERRRRQA